eukprot:15217730-Alexandrium_andersonii.AAC.1
MDDIQRAWDAAERASALRDNGDKCVQWALHKGGGWQRLEGAAAKALGVELARPRFGATAKEADTTEKACTQARL